MVIPNELGRFFEIPADCPMYDERNPDFRCSVDYSPYRKERAKSEVENPPVAREYIVSQTNSFFRIMKIDSDCIEQENVKGKKITEHNLVLKFTKDGYLGVVATGSFPMNIDFDNKRSSSRLISSVDKEWDETGSLIFTLPGVSKEEAVLLKRGVGNFLAYGKRVPIVDFFSHNWGDIL